MRKLLNSIIAFITIIAPIYCYAQTTQPQTPNVVNLMFILTAKTAILKANRPGLYTLTFIGINPYLTYYTNRPNRTQGLATIGNFMKAWNVGQNNFQTNPPNALITATKINNLENINQQFYIFTLTSPKYSQQQNAIQFVAKPLSQKILFKDIRFDNTTMVIN